MRTITKTLYEFDDLSDNAKENARQWYREGGLDYEWWDCVFDDAKQIGLLMGIDIKDIFFRLWSQGAGACFVGDYSYEKDSVKKVTEYAPQDKELHRIVKELRATQKRYFYQLTANVKHQGHYEHKYCTVITVHKDWDYAPEEAEKIIDQRMPLGSKCKS